MSKVQWITAKSQARDYEGKWCALPVGDKVELRKSFTGNPGFFAQALVVVQDSKSGPEVVMSMNGKVAMSLEELSEMHSAALAAWLHVYKNQEATRCS